MHKRRRFNRAQTGAHQPLDHAKLAVSGEDSRFVLKPIAGHNVGDLD